MAKFTLIASNGRWGKGDTPLEAAQNASVTSVKSFAIFCVLYQANPDVVDGDIDVTHNGGTRWNWNPTFANKVRGSHPDLDTDNIVDEGSQLILDLVQQSLCVGRGKMHIHGNFLMVEANLSALLK